MPSNLWGGSEELWSLLAKEMHLNGEKVTILVNHKINNFKTFQSISKYKSNYNKKNPGLTVGRIGPCSVAGCLLRMRMYSE